MTYLGGHAIYLGPQDIGLGTRESIPDIAGTLSRYVSIIMARVFAHKTLEDLAAASSVPVINALSDREHPCQTLADLLTMKEQCGSLRGLTVAFVGDGENNVTHSLALAACKLGMHLRIASPKEYQPLPDIIEEAQKLAVLSGGSVILTKDPVEAVKGAKVVYTDTWVSMGDEKEKAKRLKDFRTYQINAAIMKKALPDAIFLHDMPAYRGNEVSAEVIDGKQSRIFDQAENRLHAQMALVILLLGARMP
jgi:ornithine carbamoyltransferase